jgi:1,4-dihydroxy-2-naphthoate octaprenyltransferase
MVVGKINLSFELLLGFISWFFLCSGITLFNSYYDKDEEPVGGLQNPPKVTTSLLIASIIFKIFGFVIALLLNKYFLFIYFFGIIFSILYSHKAFRLKSYALVSITFNFIIGFTSFLSASSFDFPREIIIILGSLSSGLFLTGTYILMQIHQTIQDKERDYSSLAMIIGKKKTLIISFILILLAAILSSLTIYISLGLIFIITSIIFFCIFFLLLWVWFSKSNSRDFEMMSLITIQLSFLANFLLAMIYIIEVIGI